MTYELPVSRILPVYRFDPWTRTLRDNAADNAPSIAGTGLKWIRQRGVDGLRATGTGRLVALNTALLEAITDLSVFWWGDLNTPGVTRTILDKQDGGGIQFKVGYDYSGGDRIFLDDGSNVRTVSVSLGKVRTGCITLESGAIGNAYLNGATIGALSGVSTITGDDADLTLLNAYDGSEPFLDRTSGLFLYAGILTAEEVSQLDVYARAIFSSYISPNRKYWDRGSWVPIQDPNDIASLDLGKSLNGEVADRSGDESHGTMVGGVNHVNTPAGRGMTFQDNGNVNVNTMAAKISPTIGYVEMVVQINNASGSQYLFSSNSNVRDHIWITGGSLEYQRGNPGVSVVFGAPMLGKVYHLVGQYNNGSMEFFVNGVSQGTDTFLSTAQASIASIGDFRNAGSGRALNSDFLYMRRGNVLLSLVEIQARYNRIAVKALFHETWNLARPTITDATVGMYLDGTRWQVITGSWANKEDADGTYPECITDGKIRYVGISEADTWYTKTFEQKSGAPTLTKNANNIEIDGVTGDQVGEILLTLGIEA